MVRQTPPFPLGSPWRQILWLIYLILFCGVGPTACQEVSPVAVAVETAVSTTTAPPPPATIPPSATNQPLPATNTPPPAFATPTPTFTPTTTATATPFRKPTGTPTLTATPTATAVLSHFFRLSGFSAPITKLWAAPDGTVWVLGNTEAYLLDGETWHSLWPGQVNPLGIDHQGRIWAILNGDTLAHYTPGNDWQRYGPAWEADLAYPTDPVSGLAVDRSGQVWVAHGRNGLHRFDPNNGTWVTLTATEMGYPPPPPEDADFAHFDAQLYVTAVTLDSAGNIWVAACPLLIYEDGPISQQLRDGDGARWFDGQNWAGPGDTAGRCLWDLDVDQQGRIWLSGPQNDLWGNGNDFLVYYPDLGWRFLPVPLNEALFPQQPGFVSQILIAADGSPWLFVERRGGATFPPPGIYQYQYETWQAIMDVLPGQISLDANGAAWFYLYEPVVQTGQPLIGVVLYHKGVYQVFEPLPEELNPETITAGNGRAWFVGVDGRSLWYIQP